jgi:hypothetical protein
LPYQKVWANDLKRSFTKEDMYMDKKHMEICSISLVLGEMQSKTK